MGGDSWWNSVASPQLAQGDLLPECCLPIFVDPTPKDTDEADEIEVVSQRLIVVTQSCDLENNKVEFVALCPIHTLYEFAEANPHYKQSTKNWEDVRRGKIHALHLVGSPESPDSNVDSLVIDFGQIVSLPLHYLNDHADSLGDRWRLRSPFLEHFSQAFARFFMRVGLPSGIKPFK